LKLSRKTLLNKVPFSILDLETTGLRPREGDRIIEVAVAKIVNGREEDVFHTLVQPDCILPNKVSYITGITSEMLNGAPYFADIASDVRGFIDDTVIVCHNAPFDLSFLIAHFEESNIFLDRPYVVDTLKFARSYFNFPGNALRKIADYLSIERERDHRALEDVRITAKILQLFIENLQKRFGIENLGDLLELQQMTKKEITAEWNEI